MKSSILSLGTNNNPHLISIKDYANSVEFLAKTNSKLIFESFGSENTAIIISTIFKHSKEIVRIYAKSMNGEISSDHIEYIESLNDFLYSGKSIKILLDTNECFDSNKLEKHNTKLIRVFRRFMYTGNIDIRIANDKFKNGMIDISTDGSSAYHFTVGDDQMVRIEKDNSTHSAICSFNNLSMCKPIIRTFDTHFDMCKHITI